MNELILKKCNKCNALIKVLNDCTCKDCGIKCCNDFMVTIKPNISNLPSHIPSYELIEDEIYVKINHVMEKEHYIEYIFLVKDNIISEVKLYPEMDAECRFKYIKNSTIYAYCNKHGLWKIDVK